MTKVTDIKDTNDGLPVNLAMWNRLMPTNPKYTKAFDRGGFKGTATNGTYIVQRLTEEFGPCGIGWRFVIEDDRVQEGHTLKNGDKAKLHIVRGHLDYRADTDMACEVDGWFSTSPQFGQTMLVGENKYGTFTDEEAPKKSITDAISKCAVLLGIAADVHLGLFDDSKYVNDRKREEAAEVPFPTAEKTVLDRQTPAEDIPRATAAPDAPQENDLTIARQVFSLVKSVCEKAEDVAEINDCLKHNKASLAVLERASKVNYDGLKDIVEAARKRLTPADPELNDDPSFLSQ